ncbi:hypothetical protein EDB85DRAFT_2149456 [Lactarius pseudohatsudake]|nr:hypothetical protein EDB85DRAFT_2149456 [Lactarius pseudohatsudake]
MKTPPPESQPINHGSIALPNLPMPSSSAPKPHANNLFRLQDPAMYLGHISPPPSKRRPPPPSLAILGQLAYSPGVCNPTPLSS